MELIDRYIYAVTQRLPEQQRADIKQELQGLIEDMMEERAPAGQASREVAEGVLLELGHPNALAAKYRGYDRYLIGPLMFEPYLTTLKIVLISIAIAMTGIFAIESIVEPHDVLEHFTDFLVSLVIAAAQGFGWVTIVFALIDYRQQKNAVVSQMNKGWKPSDLPPIPDRNMQIKMSEPIAGIIFTVLFTVLCLYSIDLVGVWRFHDGERTVIPFLNADVFRNYLPMVGVLAALGILKECIRIIVRKRTGKMIAFHIVLSVVVTVLVCVMLSDPAIWNADFIHQMQTAGILSAGGEDYDTVVSIWSRISDWLVIIIGFFALLDIISETYKWYRMKTSA
ncbi:hypothetical protein [Paenibacillus spongiae]|uniref:ABC transporter permease n=1 Tax=Paenibacillus spongiae TaxID=2909671 RepID=A0ABY5SIF3_9BACL|nr:hypothetical protein [Paenibacillus spongiae]UVI33353.1 hypothetical protein L1F29_16580 [Paenibacillus spongiae]